VYLILSDNQDDSSDVFTTPPLVVFKWLTFHYLKKKKSGMVISLKSGISASIISIPKKKKKKKKKR